MILRNQSGPSGVPLGGIGVGYFEISPDGFLTRNCINNIHRSIIDTPDGFMIAVHDGDKAVRLQRDDKCVFGMKGYKNSEYRGLWPVSELSFNGEGMTDMGYTAYSGVAAHDVKNSSLPVVFFEVLLRNDSDADREMSALLSWGDLIGRGIRDTEQVNLTDYNGDSDAWFDMAYPDTYSDCASVDGDRVRYTGVRQYAKEKIIPIRATFQNYNNAFLILAEVGAGRVVTVKKSFDVKDENAFADFIETGRLAEPESGEVKLSDGTDVTKRKVSNAGAVCVSVKVAAGKCETVRFALSWFMPEFTDEDYEKIRRFAKCDYGKYYHNFYADIDSLTSYAISHREDIRNAVGDWQKPLLESSLPEWLVFKQINSGYTLYTNAVLNKKGNFSTLEGEMGGYGGTMDQKMSSYVFYEKLFPTLNLTENLQYANVTGAHGEIQHFDIHYYYGMADYDPENRENPTPAGSMTDNTGSWMMQMWNHWRTTGDFTLLRKHYGVMKTSMAFIKSKCPEGTHIPSYNTTYDDYRHPPVMIYSAPVWLLMLKIGAEWADLCGDRGTAEEYRAEYVEAAADTEVLFGKWHEEYSPYYAFGCDGDYIAARRNKGTAELDVMFSGAVAGQFMSRLFGLGDVIPFDNFVSHIDTFLSTSVQLSRDYYAPKVFNIRTEQDMDNDGSRCWPFYLESYGGMAAIYAGYAEDGMKLQKHAMDVDLRLGYMWTRNLWNRGYVTYMTAPVTWMIGDVLAGCAVDVPNRTLTLGPVCAADEEISVPLYYPKFWARLDCKKSVLTYTITRTFFAEGESAVFDTVVSAPFGKAAADGTKIALDKPFAVTEGAVLDLSAYIDNFRGNAHPSMLLPTEPYERPKPEHPAMGTGLTAEITGSCGIRSAKITKVDCVFDGDNPLTAGTEGEFSLTLEGSLLPRYSQKYQLIFEYTGSLDVQFHDGAEIDVSDNADDIESLQYIPNTERKILVITRLMKAGKLCPLTVSYSASVGEGCLKLLWWSTTQQMSTIIKERLYPVTRIGEMIDASGAIGENNCAVEHDHIAYTCKNCYAVYNRIDFGEGGHDFRLKISAGAPKNHVSDGGIMEIRLDSPDGALLGEMEFTPTGDWGRYCEFTAGLHSDALISGTNDICFVFRPKSEFLLNYNRFMIEKI